MKPAKTIIAACFLLTACDYSMTPAPANLTAECPALEPVEAKDMGDLLGICLETTEAYNQCRAKHKALVEGMKPHGFWGLFK